MGARVGMGLAGLGAIVCLLLLISGIIVSANDLILVTALGLAVCVALTVWFARAARQP